MENNFIKNGAFQVARKLFESEIWLDKPSTWKVLWIYILGRVNHQKDQTCDEGEGFFRWSREIYLVGNDLAPDIIKKAVHFFKIKDMISTRRSTRGVYIKVLNYNRYQTLDNYTSTKKSTTPSTREALEKHQTSTTIDKNDKNVKNDIKRERVANAPPTPKDEASRFFKVVEDKGSEFVDFIKKISEKVPEKFATEEIYNFYRYWTELTPGGLKQRWECQKTFEVQKRLATWFNRAGKWSKTGGVNNQRRNFV